MEGHDGGFSRAPVCSVLVAVALEEGHSHDISFSACFNTNLPYWGRLRRVWLSPGTIDLIFGRGGDAALDVVDPICRCRHDVVLWTPCDPIMAAPLRTAGLMNRNTSRPIQNTIDRSCLSRPLSWSVLMICTPG